MTSELEKLITEQYGDRCPEYDAYCPCCQIWAEYDTRAEPDVPELVRYTVVCQYHEDDGHPYADTFKHENGEYVLHSQAAEIIAAERSEKHRAQEAVLKLERELAQYEAQRPVAWVDENGMAAFTLGCISTVHTKFETSKSERFCFPLYASPAPAADLKAENEEIRGHAMRIIKAFDPDNDLDNPEKFNAYHDLEEALKGESNV